MIAEIHGKIASTGSNLSDRLEDQLTGDVFGSLRYLDSSAALLPYLVSSYFLSSELKRHHPDNFMGARLKEILFWPWVDAAEPDILLKLELNGHKECVICIEAKYYSGLSSDDYPEFPSREGEHSLRQGSPDRNESSTREESHNQLVRQMRGMKKVYPQRRRVQIFLTADRIYPNEVLSRVRQRSDLEGLNDTEIYWLSWHDLPAILRISYEGGAQLSERERIIVRDLLSLCERKGFGRFSRMEFHLGTVPSKPKIMFQNRLYQTPRNIPIRIHNIPNAVPPFIVLSPHGVPINRPANYLEG